MIDFPNVNPQKADIQQFFYNRGPSVTTAQALPTTSFSEYVWHKPSGISFVYALIIGGGGGGGGGSTVGGGGGGGGAAGTHSILMPAKMLPSSLGVVVGAGGSGGASGVAGRSGNSSGLISVEARLILAGSTGSPFIFYASSVGTGGNASTGASGGTAGAFSNTTRTTMHMYRAVSTGRTGGNGGSSTSTGFNVPGAGVFLPYFTSNGAGGGGFNASYLGGSQLGWATTGGQFNIPTRTQPAGGGRDGLDGILLTQGKFYSCGGNGGNGNSSGQGGNGGRGAIGSGGGGGGGGGSGSNTGGTGGAGGDGYVLIVSW